MTPRDTADSSTTLQPFQRCSYSHDEPLAGTAKQDSMYVLFEWPQGWSRDILDGDTFGPELSQAISSHLGKRAGLQLVRHPGRAGRDVGKLHRLYLVYPECAYIEMKLVDGPEAITELDLSGPGRNNATEVIDPLILVCTHGKRDVCCAVKGRPLAAQLDQLSDKPNIVWETSHTKGHRFAPSILLMPWGYSFGRLNDKAGQELIQTACQGQYYYPGNRGRGIYDPASQSAEVDVARSLLEAGESLNYDDLISAKRLPADHQAHGGAVDNGCLVEVRHRDGRAWHVSVEKREVEGVISSCGDQPGTKTAWVAIKTSHDV